MCVEYIYAMVSYLGVVMMQRTFPLIQVVLCDIHVSFAIDYCESVFWCAYVMQAVYSMQFLVICLWPIWLEA